MSLHDWQNNSWLVRQKRNIVGYETAGLVSEREAREMHELAAGLRDDVLTWLRKNRPKLLPG